MRLQMNKHAPSSKTTEACKLITWIVQKDRRNPRSLSVACNLVYGNTIVLSHQVARLLIDAVRAREIVAFTSYLAEEEERRRRTREQMEIDLDTDYTTPKKKRKSKAAEDDYLITPQTPISTALKQNITMPDAFATPRIDFMIEDDLMPPTEEAYAMLYGPMNSENPNNDFDLTFMDRFSSSHIRREDVHNETLDFVKTRLDDFEFERPSNELIGTLHETPVKNNYTMIQDDEIFEPHPALADVLRHARLPLFGEQEERRSMEQEMNDARLRGIHAEFDVPTNLDVPHIPSHISLDEDVLIPPVQSTPKTPRTPRRLGPTPFRNRNLEDEILPEQNKFRIPLKEMNNMMENYSSLHYDHPSAFRPKRKKPMPLAELLNTVPYSLRKNCNKELAEQFPKRATRFDPTIRPNVSSDEEEEEEEEENLRNSAAPQQNFDDLEPINLSQLKFKETPLKVQSPIASPLRAQFDFEDLQMEQPRRQEEPPLENPISPVKYQDDQFLDDPYNYARSFGTVYTGSSSEDKTADTIRENLFMECEKVSPFSYQLDLMVDINKTTRREAARTFYVALELPKERAIKASQITPYGPIDLTIAAHDSEDLEELAAIECDDGDF
ncbi:hypothetical protein CAEBREN_15567 [Caenorhabditis brenneri]|uniref:Rad21/Rec8-like protein C-terminal eukaryotic domain-containing protein n=1 Tax=Caenorhabditis brenneri TaxID=135651 RepID=G0NQ38_CAEBE|nr:hypothetical protein CAEBREN_15567 [Caenorhabditis brenneri]